MTLPASVSVAVDGQELTAAEAALTWLEVSLGVPGHHDSCVLGLWHASRLAGTAPGATVDIALGAQGDEVAVWSGVAAWAEKHTHGLTLFALSPTSRLSESFRAQTYLRQSVADVVEDLASEVEVAVVDCQVVLESYSVDRRSSVWDHLLDLSRLTGSRVSASPSGGLRFVPSDAAAAAHSLHHGIDLVEWSIETLAGSERSAVAAHGAGSEQGSSRWHWLRNDPASAAGDRPVRVVGAFHTRDAAERLDAAMQAAATRAETRGELEVWGRPEVRPGDRLDLLDLPDGDRAVTAVSVRHRLDAHSGFRTSCRIEGSDEATGLLGAVGL